MPPPRQHSLRAVASVLCAQAMVEGKDNKSRGGKEEPAGKIDNNSKANEVQPIGSRRHIWCNADKQQRVPRSISIDTFDACTRILIKF